MKLCQVGGIQGLISEDPVDGEVLLWGELVLPGQLDENAAVFLNYRLPMKLNFC
jgi:hypothetical protein